MVKCIPCNGAGCIHAYTDKHGVSHIAQICNFCQGEGVVQTYCIYCKSECYGTQEVCEECLADIQENLEKNENTPTAKWLAGELHFCSCKECSNTVEIPPRWSDQPKPDLFCERCKLEGCAAYYNALTSA
jgi:hypothetical protein